MRTTNPPTNQKTQNDPAHDLGQIGGKTRANTYKGKYPERIKSISGGFKDGAWHRVVETNGGALFEFMKLHGHAKSPEPGQEIELWILSLDPINDAADTIMRKYLFNV